MTIQHRPYAVDFVDNNPKYEFHTAQSGDVQMLAQFRVEDADGHIVTTPEFWLDHNDGNSSIGCKILKAYFPAPQIPPYNGVANAPTICKNSILKVKSIYADTLVVSNGQLVPFKATDTKEILLVNGELPTYEHKNNIPDWQSGDGNHFYKKKQIDIFSQNNNETLFVDMQAEQYLYICNFHTQNISAPLEYSYTKLDGTTGTNIVPITFKTKTITQISVSPAAFGLNPDEIFSLKLFIANNNINRTFIRKEFEYGAHTMLLLNSMNLYESFTVDYVSEEKQTEGERTIYETEDSYLTTDRQTIFTAKCNPENHNSVKLLRTAFEKQHNLLVDGEFVWQLDFIPGTLKIYDETSDLIEIEFQFRKRKKINRAPQLIPAIRTNQSVLRTNTIFR